MCVCPKIVYSMSCCILFLSDTNTLRVSCILQGVAAAAKLLPLLHIKRTCYDLEHVLAQQNWFFLPSLVASFSSCPLLLLLFLLLVFWLVVYVCSKNKSQNIQAYKTCMRTYLRSKYNFMCVCLCILYMYRYLRTYVSVCAYMATTSDAKCHFTLNAQQYSGIILLWALRIFVIWSVSVDWWGYLSKI